MSSIECAVFANVLLNVRFCISVCICLFLLLLLLLLINQCGWEFENISNIFATERLPIDRFRGCKMFEMYYWCYYK